MGRGKIFRLIPLSGIFGQVGYVHLISFVGSMTGYLTSHAVFW